MKCPKCERNMYDATPPPKKETTTVWGECKHCDLLIATAVPKPPKEEPVAAENTTDDVFEDDCTLHEMGAKRLDDTAQDVPVRDNRSQVIGFKVDMTLHKRWSEMNDEQKEQVKAALVNLVISTVNEQAVPVNQSDMVNAPVNAPVNAVNAPVNRSSLVNQSVNEPDMVNHPSHYTIGGIEVIDVQKSKLTPEGFRGYLLGCAIKYILRAGHKTEEGTVDLKKAIWYLQRLIKERE